MTLFELKILHKLINRFQKRYFPERSGEAHYLICGMDDLLNMIIRDNWRRK